MLAVHKFKVFVSVLHNVYFTKFRLQNLPISLMMFFSLSCSYSCAVIYTPILFQSMPTTELIYSYTDCGVEPVYQEMEHLDQTSLACWPNHFRGYPYLMYGSFYGQRNMGSVEVCHMRNVFRYELKAPKHLDARS